VAPRRLVSLGDALRTPVPTARRGVFVLPPRAVWSRDPFGLFAATALSLPAVTVVVHPAPAPDADCGRAVDAGGPHRAALAAATTNPATRDGLGDLIGLRPYVPGDRLSLLHWPARARYGTWFVRQFGTEDPTAGCLVIDDRAAVHRRRDFERLLGVALALVERAGARGETVALETVTGRTFTFLPTPAGLEQARWALAAIQPRRHGPQPGSLRGMVLTTATGSRTLVGIPPDRLVVAA
jgi:uncharacterized protein (DUF58 family)